MENEEKARNQKKDDLHLILSAIILVIVGIVRVIMITTKL